MASIGIKSILILKSHDIDYRGIMVEISKWKP